MLIFCSCERLKEICLCRKTKHQVMELTPFRALRWLIFGELLIIIFFSGTYRIYKYYKLTTLEARNFPDKNMSTTIIKFKNEGSTTARQHQTMYTSPNICGKEWKTKYQALHDDIINTRRESKFLVYTCPWTNSGCCGYGNRVYAIVSLFYLAVLTNRAFLIDWTAPKPLTQFLKPSSINWNFPIPRLETRKHYWRTGGEKDGRRDGWLAKSSPRFIAWMRRENVLNYFDKPVEVATTILFFANSIRRNKYVMKRAGELKITPILPEATKYDMIGCAYDILFRPTKRLQNALENTRKALCKKKNYIIGIHIRLGDDQFGRDNTSRVSDYQQFFSCALKVERQIFKSASKTNKKQMRWFLATDSIIVKDYARKYFPKKVITDENKPEHLDIYKKNEKPSEEGMLGVLHDHYMLAESDFLVLSDSSFSRTAVGLGMRTSDTYTLGNDCDLTWKKPF